MILVGVSLELTYPRHLSGGFFAAESLEFMTLEISTKVDVEQAIKDFGRIKRKQIPFGVATGLTRLAYKLTLQEQRLAMKQLHKPTPWTVGRSGKLSAFKYVRANYRHYKSGRMEAISYIKRDRAAFLKFTVHGGIRFPKHSMIAVPVPKNFKTNTYGNIGKGKIKSLLKKPNVFQGTIKGIPGVWQRPKRGARRKGGSGTVGATGLTLLIAYEPKTVHSLKPFTYYKFAKHYVARNLQKEVKKGLANAIKPKPAK